MEAGQSLLAAEVAGDFVLPNSATKLAFLAGGIGITPFRSMVQAMIDSGDRRDVVVVDSHSRPEHRVFDDVFDQAKRELGTKVVHTLTDPASVPEGWIGERGPVDAALLRRNVPDLHDRTFFVSGPPAFVDAVVGALRSLQVSRWRIRTDFFPGY